STQDALVRMEGLAASNNAGLPYQIIQSQVRGNVHLLIHQQKISDYDKNVSRRIVEVAEMIEGNIRLLFSWDYKLRKHVTHVNLNDSHIFKRAERSSIIL